MTPVRIYNPNVAAASSAELEALLKSADCHHVSEADFAKSLIVIASSELEKDAALEPAIIAAMNEGMCIVALWPQKPDTTELPDALKKYATASISWSSALLAKAGKCEEVESFERPGGGKSHMEHHNC